MSRFFQSSLQKRSATAKSALAAVCATFAVLAVLPSGKTSKVQHEENKEYSEAITIHRKTSAPVPTRNLKQSQAAERISGAMPSLNLEPAENNIDNAIAFSNLSAQTQHAFEPQIPGAGDFSAEGEFDGIFDFGSLDKTPKRLSKAKVSYPAEMLRRGIEGDVELSIIIEKDGSVRVEKVISSSSEAFEKSALEAASKLIYEPPTKGGKPVRARFTLPVPFRISR